jgi:hypothetical protein
MKRGAVPSGLATNLPGQRRAILFLMVALLTICLLVAAAVASTRDHYVPAFDKDLPTRSLTYGS